MKSRNQNSAATIVFAELGHDEFSSTNLRGMNVDGRRRTRKSFLGGPTEHIVDEKASAATNDHFFPFPYRSGRTSPSSAILRPVRA